MKKLFNSTFMLALSFGSLIQTMDILTTNAQNFKWHVINGHDVSTNKYPWFATIRQVNDRVDHLPIGGGVLVANNWVLTAAHLFDSSWDYNREPNIKITFNQNDLTTNSLQTVLAEKVIRAPHVEDGNDLALVKLSQPVANIEPIQLINHQPLTSHIATVMGYGATNHLYTETPTKLQAVDLPVIDKKNHIDYLTKIGYVNCDYDLLAGAIGGPKIDSAPGDSGGPLVQTINGQTMLIGIVKGIISGHFKDPNQVPSIYTSIYQNVDWINETVNSNDFSINQKLLIQKHFLKSFDFSQHQFTTKTTRAQVENFVKSEIKTIFDRPFKLTMKNNQGNVIDHADNITYGDWFDFEIESLWFKTNFRFTVKNVGDKSTHLNQLAAIKNKFNDEINFDQHKLTTQHTRSDAFVYVNNEINKIVDRNYNLTMKGLNPSNKIVNNADNVWHGDWFDFTLTISDFTPLKFRFKAKNVAGDNKQINNVYWIEDYFRRPLLFVDHQLTTLHHREHVHRLIHARLVSFLNDDDFTLTMAGYNPKKNIINTSDQVSHGDWFDFKLVMSQLTSNFRVKLQNVGNDVNQGQLWDVIDDWHHNFQTLSNFNSMQTMADVEQWLQKQLKNKFDSDKLKLQINNYQPQQKLNNSTTEITVTITVGLYSEIVNTTINPSPVESGGHNVQKFFADEFLFYHHQLTTWNTRQDVYNLVNRWIKNMICQSFELTMANFNPKTKVVNDSSIVSNGDWFDFTLLINNEAITFRFKARNVQNRIGIGYLWDLKKIFPTSLDPKLYEIKSTTTYKELQIKIEEIIKSFFINLHHTFKIEIQTYALWENIGSGTQKFTFKATINKITALVDVWLKNIM